MRLDGVAVMSSRSDKRVVIYGGGVAGAHLAKELVETGSVTLADPNVYFEVPIAARRGLVRPEFA